MQIKALVINPENPLKSVEDLKKLKWDALNAGIQKRIDRFTPDTTVTTLHIMEIECAFQLGHIFIPVWQPSKKYGSDIMYYCPIVDSNGVSGFIRWRDAGPFCGSTPKYFHKLLPYPMPQENALSWVSDSIDEESGYVACFGISGVKVYKSNMYLAPDLWNGINSDEKPKDKEISPNPITPPENEIPEEVPTSSYCEWMDKYIKDLQGTLKAIEREKRAMSTELCYFPHSNNVKVYDRGNPNTLRYIRPENAKDIVYELFVPMGHIESAIKALKEIRNRE